MTYIKEFEKIIAEQKMRVERMKNEGAPIDFTKKESVIIGVIAGDGIGPIIADEAQKVLEHVLRDEITNGKIQLRSIGGLTIENRIAVGKAIPDSVLAEIKECDVILKGPTTTPDKKMGVANIESANVALRRELDLFANVRPVNIPEENINWTFFRENTEGEYILGSRGVDVDDVISVDFKVTTTQGTRRIARAAFEYAKINGNLNVSIITKANIMKKTDGKFLSLCLEVAREYPEINVDDYYVDIMSANLLKAAARSRYNVFVLPNLYGDIITDEAAQLQGGVGTAGSANIGSRYAMFEAIHGSAPRMMNEGRGKYANPASMIKASEMLLRHIGYADKADKLLGALMKTAKEKDMSGVSGSDTAEDFAASVIKYFEEA